LAEIKTLSSNSFYSLYSVVSEDLPENTFILSSEPTRKILFNPHIAGKKLQDMLECAGEIFIQVLKDTSLRGVKLDNCCELIFLSGGLYYNLNHGFKKIYNEVLPQCFLGIKRSRIEGKEGQFTAYATYENFESLPDNATVIIGDTIASGATLQKGLQNLFDALEEKNYTLDKLIILTLAGSTLGARRFKEVEKKIKIIFPNAKFYLFASEQLFHVMPNGTDLRFLREDSIIPESSKKNVIEQYGEVLGREMQCAVFDWGTRCKNPKAHYHEFLEFCDSISKTNLDEKGRQVIQRMKKETEEELKSFEMVL